MGAARTSSSIAAASKSFSTTRAAFPSLPQESVTEVLDGDDAVLPVRDRAVVIGVVAESVRDDVITPFSTGFGTARAVRGMTMHALLADQLAREALYGVPIVKGPSRALENLWIWSWALAGVLLGIRLRYTIQALAGIGAGLAMLGGAVYAAFGAAVLLPAIPAAIAWVGSAGVTNRVLHAASNRDRARLRRTFEHYLPPVVIADMIGSDALPKLGGERREISVLFTEHSMDVVFAFADRIIVLARGRLIADGNAAAIRDNLQVREVYFGTGKTFAGAKPGAKP